LFSKQYRALSPEQKNLVTKKSKPGATVNMLVTLPAGVAIVAGNFDVALAGVIFLEGGLIVLSAMHKKSLRDLGFTSDYLARSAKISYLGAAGGFLAVASILWDKYLASGQ
jgi:hypothetical protein